MLPHLIAGDLKRRCAESQGSSLVNNEVHVGGIYRLVRYQRELLLDVDELYRAHNGEGVCGRAHEDGLIEYKLIESLLFLFFSLLSGNVYK